MLEEDVYQHDRLLCNLWELWETPYPEKTCTEKTEKSTVKVKERVKDSGDYQEEPQYEDTGESNTEATGKFENIDSKIIILEHFAPYISYWTEQCLWISTCHIFVINEDLTIP